MKKGIAVLTAVCLFLCAGVFLLLRREQADGIPAETSEDREIYLFSQGWKGRELTAREITVPDTDDAVFAAYAALQETQGLPLSRYAGKRAVMYVYRLEQSPLYAQLLVADGRLIGAMCTDPAAHDLLGISGKS
ncbi:MAG: DUF4830 domain-containing protein [Oscillospiraceae bacterium]|nr:DUF4830 domain-containing protein [Oscillospiraceae bacterium]